MAKEIDKIIQSKTAPKSNNVLWDDGENLKINRNGKWESTGTQVPQEKIDSINFGYYTFASNGITANWGPFNIKVGEIKTIDTLFWGWEPTYVKVENEYIRISWNGETGYVNSVSGHLDFKYIQNKITIDATHINKACIIQFYNYRKLNINEDTCMVDSYLLHNLSLIKEVNAYEGDKFEVDILSSLAKYTKISTFTSSKEFSIFSGLLLFYDNGYNNGQFTHTFKLLNYENVPCVITVVVYCDSNFIVTDYDSTTQEISLK